MLPSYTIQIGTSDIVIVVVIVVVTVTVTVTVHCVFCKLCSTFESFPSSSHEIKPRANFNCWSRLDYRQQNSGCMQLNTFELQHGTTWSKPQRGQYSPAQSAPPLFEARQ